MCKDRAVPEDGVSAGSVFYKNLELLTMALDEQNCYLLSPPGSVCFASHPYCLAFLARQVDQHRRFWSLYPLIETALFPYHGTGL